MTTTPTQSCTIRDAQDGLRLPSGPGRDLVFKVTGEETGGALDYFIVDVAPHSGPPLHIHNVQGGTLHVLQGRFKVQVGEESFELERGGFAYMPPGVPHAFRNLTDEDGELIVTFTPGGGHHFFAELGPVARSGSADKAELAAIFERHDLQLVGPPLQA